MSLTALTKHFESIKDPRQQIKVIYSLHDVLFLTVKAIIAGCKLKGANFDFRYQIKRINHLLAPQVATQNPCYTNS